MQTTDYLQTPYPENTDLADLPKQMRNMATSWENAWAGIWIDWNPVVTQSGGGEPAAMTIDLSTSVRKVCRIGRTVYVQARLDVSAGTGLSGYPRIYLPHPMANPYIPAGVVGSKIGSGFSAVAALSPVPTDPNYHGVVEAFGGSSPRVAGDWFALLLRYETV